MNPQSVKSQSYRQSVDSRWTFRQCQEQTTAFRWEEEAEGRQRQNNVDFDFEALKKRAEEQAEEAPEGRKVSFLSPFQEKTQENTESPAEAPLNMLAASAIRNRQIRAITKRRRHTIMPEDAFLGGLIRGQ